MTLPAGLYAHFTTSEGAFTVKLFDQEAPKTVATFAGLVQGTRAWQDPVTRQQVNKPFYDGLVFHRIIEDFVIQGGCPMGNGLGGPGFQFEDEFHPSLKHGKAGMLSMANAGPNTNGSQFFVTLAATPHLDNRHSVFGEVVSGLDVVSRIGHVPTGRADRPVKDIVIESVKVERGEPS